MLIQTLNMIEPPQDTPYAVTEADMRGLYAHTKMSLGANQDKIIQTIQLHGAKSIMEVVNNPSSENRAAAKFWSELYANWSAGYVFLTNDAATVAAGMVESAKIAEQKQSTNTENVQENN